MKKNITFFILTLLSVCLCNGQSKIKAMKLSNTIYDLVKEGKIEKAVANANEVFVAFPEFLVSDLHSNISNSISRNENNAHLYIQNLHELENEDLRTLVFPIYVWSQSKKLNPTDNASKVVENFKQLIKWNSDYGSRSDRYAYLSMKELLNKRFISDKEYEYYLEKCIANTLTEVNDYSAIKEIEKRKVNAWRRFLLSYFYHDMYQLTSSEEFLEKAAFYGSNMEDNNYGHEFFYDNLLFSGSTNKVNHKITYYTFLKEAQQTKKAFELLNEITFIYPKQKNLALLKKQFELTERNESFEEFWLDYFNKKAFDLPEKETIYNADLTGITKSNQDYWLLIDVWGTWCEPCVEELPILQDFYATNQKNKNSKLKIHTLSYASRNLEKFMKKNNYSFPVHEVDKAIIELLKVDSFPTKLLISPQGKFIRLPHSDWKSYTENYTQINNISY